VRLDSRYSFVQIEVTTFCNFGCFYCAGREMPKQHMSMPLFDKIVSILPENTVTVSLQGEGEPTLHPHFWQMVDKVVKNGHTPYTITNGSHLDFERIAENFPRIGFSVDTADSVEAEKIGRYGLKNVLANLEQLSKLMADRIIVHSVDYGQPLEELNEYLDNLGITRRVIQPIRAKADYSRRYPQLQNPASQIYHFRCKYIFNPSMVYFNVNGRAMPCYSIKDTAKFVSAKHIRQQLQQRTVPECCVGCREICMRSV